MESTPPKTWFDVCPTISLLFHSGEAGYLYIPLGGDGSRKPRNGASNATAGSGSRAGGPNPLLARARGVFNTLVVFMYVAVWHDINLRLLMWGWLITLFVLPEIIAGLIFPASRFRSRPTTYRVLCGLGAVLNVLMMMAANLVGFALGLDGLKGLLAGIVGSYSGVMFMITACGVLYVGVQVMFEVREAEHRRGIDMKC
jgi:D-alanyl-lipoteichoic acid acyltransferase DltB (MBOAT superfamily)